MKSCIPKYIKDNFDKYPNLAERLTNIHDNIWNRIIDSNLFRKYGETYLFSKPKTEQNNKQIEFISKINKDFNVPEGSKVIKSAPTIVGNNMKVLVNVLSLAQREWDNNEGKQQTLFQNNNKQNNNQEEDLPYQKVSLPNDNNTPIKEGVSDIFKQSPELANAVYENLGFRQQLNSQQEFDKIANSNSELSNIAKILSKYGKGLETRIINTNLNSGGTAYSNIDTEGNIISDVAIDLNNIKAVIANRKDKQNFYEEVVLHEEIHRYTQILWAFKDTLIDKTDWKKGLIDVGLTNSDINFIQEVEELYSQYSKNKIEDSDFNQPNSDIKEFITYGLTNPQFMKGLSNIKVKNTSILDSLINALAKLFGKNISIKNALEKSFETFMSNESLIKDALIQTDYFKSEITPQQEKQAQQQYSQYLDSIFPDSKVKDIVYHGADKKIESFDFNKKINNLEKGLFFFQKQKSAQLWRDASFEEDNTSKGDLKSVILNIKTPVIEDFNDKSAWDMQNYANKNTKGDGLIAKNVNEIYVGLDNQFAVFEPEQIHILGNKQDIEEFKEFIKENINKSNNKNNQENINQQDELGYIDEQNDDTKDFIDQKDVSLLSEEDIKINNKIDELLNNGDIIQYCQ